MPEGPAISIGLIEYNSEQYTEAVALRQLVLRTPLGLKFTGENLTTDEHEFHLAASDGKQLIGILLLRPISESVIKMRQVAVHPDFQNLGIGQKLVEESEELARNMGYETMELHAREVALRFYSRLRYTTIGERFLEVGIPHFKMFKKLADK
ncbi:MAG: GNAT family N-acetyltransferase [Bacteroidia bacterium]|nr:GNAT family N-acetyltransferase [Bacteroidia bacterium]